MIHSSRCSTAQTAGNQLVPPVRPIWHGGAGAGEGEGWSALNHVPLAPRPPSILSYPTRDQHKLTCITRVDEFIKGFQVFDKAGNGFIGAGELRYVLTQLGEKMSDEEVDELLKGFPVQ